MGRASTWAPHATATKVIREADTSPPRAFTLLLLGALMRLLLCRCNVSAWLSSFAGGGGLLPLYDVGSGWGTNTLAALDRDPAVRVVAVDMTHTHLTYTRQGAHSAPGGGDMPRVGGRGTETWMILVGVVG
jgi:hypothetical protein